MVTSEYFDGVLAAEIIDHGDGTGIHEFYDSEGNITGQELLSPHQPDHRRRRLQLDPRADTGRRVGRSGHVHGRL